ncbi:S41 family peptidase [Spongiimicrobium sp. 2-473A-2-J]|uniref:S41 family peptidase n=1 Tax=Eudoraea algarum TaxID=3417568 RepID=UPI003D35D532
MKSIIGMSFWIFMGAHLLFGQKGALEKQKGEFLNDLVLSFKNEFLWTEKGEKIAEALDEKIKAGDYSSIEELDLFVATLNRDLYTLSNDLHLKIDVHIDVPKKSSDFTQQPNNSFLTKELVSHGIYYLKFDVFPRLGTDFEKELVELMSSFVNPKKIIIDVRDNSGGSDETVNHLIGYFFSNRKKLATSYQWNETPKELWAIPKPQSKALSEVELIILTSQATFSAAEIFAQRLQLHNRAVVIGEATSGAAHRTMTYLMSERFLLHWPYERSTHARTGEDLDGVGITPDHLVHYNHAKEVAVHYAKTGKVLEQNENPVPKTSALLEDLIIALNSKSDFSYREFVIDYGLEKSQNQILRTLFKFRAVWNTDFNGRITNVHHISESQSRVFIETPYGISQMKIYLDDNGKIEKLMMRQ